MPRNFFVPREVPREVLPRSVPRNFEVPLEVPNEVPREVPLRSVPRNFWMPFSPTISFPEWPRKRPTKRAPRSVPRNFKLVGTLLGALLGDASKWACPVIFKISGHTSWGTPWDTSNWLRQCLQNGTRNSGPKYTENGALTC